jgi:hypothetical protein
MEVKMTTIRKRTEGKTKARKLTVRKETVKDLEVKGRGNAVKGGGERTILYTGYCGSIGTC